MSDKSAIEWTDASWNPVRGCSIVSKGCTNCYAMKVAHRFSGPGKAYEGLTMMSNAGPVWNGEITLVPELLRQPLHWKRPRRIFVNSMSDLFHEKVPFDFIDEVFRIMLQAHWHTFQVLTKRPERMLGWADSTNARHGDLLGCPRGGVPDDPPKNIWLGVSVEDQAAADKRIPLLLEMPAAVRWISAEPLLGPIDISRWIVPLHWSWDAKYKTPKEAIAAGAYAERKPQALVSAYARFLNWVVVGGESGPDARAMHPDWVRSLRDLCTAAGVPFFFKQWGAWKPDQLFTSYNDRLPRGMFMNSHGEKPPLELLDDMMKGGRSLDLIAKWQHFSFVGKERAGRLLDGRTWDEYPK